MNAYTVILLIGSGILAGFINTLAGGGSVISLSLLILLGVPANVANGTNRISIFLQTLSSVTSFARQKLFSSKKVLWLAVPATLGSIAGALVAVDVSEKVISYSIGISMVVMVFFLFYHPDRFLKENPRLLSGPLTWWQVVIFLLVGFYGGFIQVGVGYFLIISLVLGVGFELLKANAIKNLIVFLYAAFALLVFVVNGQVHYLYGLLLSVGSVTGALIASWLAVKKGAGFIRLVILLSVILTLLQITGLADFTKLLKPLISS